MKKIFISGMLYTAWTISSFSATGNSNLSAFFEGLRVQGTKARPVVGTNLFEKGKRNNIPEYQEKTAIICAYTQPISPLTQLEWHIVDAANNDSVIGKILVQYYPQGDYPGYPQGTPLIRLRHIEIENKSFQKQGHGSRALETLFTALRTNKSFPESTLIGLEYSISDRHLGPWYDKFGFTPIAAASWSDVRIAKVPLNRVKFPYYKKAKAAKA